MINLNFNLRWPGSNRFRNIWSRNYNTPLKYKFLETQFYASADILDLSFGVTAKEDHAGIRFGIGLLGYSIDINFYDSRHWNGK